jgi:uncharacterized protein
MRIKVLYGICLILCQTIVLNCSDTGGNESTVAGYRASVQEWHHTRIESLKKPDGWLSLAGLFWLKEGENTFGSHPSNDIVFPDEAAPDNIGAFIMQDGKVRITLKPDVNVLHQGQTVDAMALQSDADGEPTILEWNTFSWYVIKRSDTEYAVRLKNSEHPGLQSFHGVDTYPIDQAWRVEAQLLPYDEPKEITYNTVYGSVQQAPSPGLLTFKIDGREYSLTPIAEPGDEQYFVMFADQTNGKETYGSGRFLSVDAPDANGRTVIDFNKAYNPPCAFTPFATCPLPPAENKLSISVLAGEKDSGMH